MSNHLTYGIVIGALLIPVYLTCIALLFLKKNNNFVRARNPFFVIVQSCGTALLATQTAFYVGIRNDMNCASKVFLDWCAFPLLAYPLILRCWGYCASYYLARARTQDVGAEKLLNYGPNTKKSTSWFVNHKNLGDANFLVKFYLYTVWTVFLPIIIFIIVTESGGVQFYGKYEYGCEIYFNGLSFFGVGIVFSIVPMVILAVMLRRSRDAFEIRNEMSSFAALWILVAPVLFWYQTAPLGEVAKVFPPAAVFLIGLIFSFFITVAFPLYLVIYDEKTRKQNGELKYDLFVNQLDLPIFRNAFYKFLQLQFCVENLLFYEAVTEWKAHSPGSDSERALHAVNIYGSFILDTGELQINISSQHTNYITDHINNNEYPIDLFDHILKEITEMMYANSYHLFMKSRLWRNLFGGTSKIKEDKIRTYRAAL